MPTALADFLAPAGYRQPRLHRVVHELTVAPEITRAAVRGMTGLRSRNPAADGPAPSGEPVLLVPGFLAGDWSLRLLAHHLRAAGLRTYRAHILSNVGCQAATGALLEGRLEAIAERRGSRVRIVGHSLGGILARGLAVRRPDLISGVVTMGSPMMAPGVSHRFLLQAAETLVLLARIGVPGVMSESCIAGECVREAWEETRRPIPPGVDFVCLYSEGDGLVDPRACVDPAARAVEVHASHLGMAVDPRVADRVVAELTSAVPRAQPA